MGKKDFKPIYKAQFSSGQKLQEFVFPDYIYKLMAGVLLLEDGSVQGVSVVFSHLSILLPPLQKVFPGYDLLKAKLDHCRVLKKLWIRQTKMQLYPTTLAEELLSLYAEWWMAFNECGAGIHYELYRNEDREIYNAIVGKA